MPRGKLDVKPKLEYLTILDETGTVAEGEEIGIDDDRLQAMHRVMVTARRLDDRLLKLQRQGRIGTFAPVEGQEAAQVGSAAALAQTDWVVPSYRENAVALWRGLPLEQIFLYAAGYTEGAAIPQGAHDLPVAIPVGTQPLHAVGIAYAEKLRGGEAVTMTYFGDGATSQGDVHEAMNMAGSFGLPVVFLCQNNQWAISVPRDRQTAARTLAQKALAYGMPGLQVDGNDLPAVHAAAREAVERARAGNGPTFIECVTYRLGLHTTADDPTKYRDEEDVEPWREREPLRRLVALMTQRDLIDDDALSELESAIDREIQDAWEATEQRIEELDRHPEAMFDHHYAELPPPLAAQRDRFRERRAGGKG
jgi:pyruvate dehydrogenase E1 component alpha subunit